MSKKQYSPEKIIKIIQEYLQGKGSSYELGKKYDLMYSTILRWAYKYRIHGAAAFAVKTRNTSYSSEFKTRCVEEVLNGKGSINYITAKYNISSNSVLRGWIKKYNSNIELKDYDPKQEVYMASAKRKTTLEERKEIVAYCIENGCDYKNTAAKFDVSYSQVYTWVRKYKANGEDGLLDKRGHHKTDEEVDELERLRRENKRLKRQLEENSMLVELLKKVKEFEGM